MVPGIVVAMLGTTFVVLPVFYPLRMRSINEVGFNPETFNVLTKEVDL
jgi:hypothetical protein